MAGGAVALSAILIDYLLSQPPVWGRLQSLILVAGLGIVALGFLCSHQGTLARISTNSCLALLSLFGCLSLGEGLLRVTGFDFAAGEARAWSQTPVYYQRPIAPTGEVFFKRPGSAGRNRP